MRPVYRQSRPAQGGAVEWRIYAVGSHHELRVYTDGAEIRQMMLRAPLPVLLSWEAKGWIRCW